MSEMLRIEDRIRVAMSADMGIKFTAEETRALAGMVVALRRIATGKLASAMRTQAKAALEQAGIK